MTRPSTGPVVTPAKGAAPTQPDLPGADVVHLDTATIYNILDARLPESVHEGGLRLAVTRMLAESRRRGRTT